MLGLLLIGRWERAELTDVRRLLTGDAAGRAGTIVHHARDLGEALAAWDGTERLDQIVIAPLFRNEFGAESLRQLTARYPLASLTVLVTSWLEGETRSGTPWPGIQRLYVDQLVPRLTRQLATPADRLPTPASVTQSAEETWLAQAKRPWPELRGAIVISSETPADRDYLCELCEAAGLVALGQSPADRSQSRTVQAVIYDAVVDLAAQPGHVQQLRRRYPAAELTILANFPRWHEIQAWQAAGATHVLSKPFVVQDLYDCLATACLSSDTAAA